MPQRIEANNPVVALEDAYPLIKKFISEFEEHDFIIRIRTKT